MATFPFELLIEQQSSGRPTESLLCKVILRAIPGNREVYDAIWNDRNVVLKVFARRLGANRRVNKEWNRLHLLRSRGLNAPEPLFRGKTRDGRYAIAIDKIVDSHTTLDAFNAASDEAERTNLLMLLCRELAKQHDKGVMQEDLHLGNFLLKDDKVFLIDPGQIKFFSQPVTRKNGISHLAWLARYLPSEHTEQIIALCREYLSVRGWDFGIADEEMFRKKLRQHTRKSIGRTIRKCLRTNKRQQRITGKGFSAVIDKAFFHGADPLSFIEHIDELMARGEILKDSSSYISRFTWNNTDIVVKRYNYRGIVYSLRHIIMSSRAKKSWLHAHRLGAIKVPTPKPLAYIDRFKGLLIHTSYIVTEYTEGQKLYYYLRNDSIDNEQRSEALRRVQELLAELAQYRLTHGDVKPSNILMSPNGPTLTDLDGMHLHLLDYTCTLRWAKDAVLIDKLKAQFIETTTDPNLHRERPADSDLMLSIIVVSWNVKQDLADCIRSISQNPPDCRYEIIVVDNASTDGSAEMVAKEFPSVTLISNEDNRGFAAANNIGIRQARGRYVLLLNPDTVVHAGSLDTLITFMENHNDVGACGPKLLNSDGTIQPSARKFPTLRALLHRYTILRILPLFRRQYRKWLMTDFTHDRRKNVDQVMGAALMVRRSVLENVGLMDEDFFMYYEEVDLCCRIKKAGWRIVFVPDAVITHTGGRSIGQIRIRKRIMTLRSVMLFLRKHRGRYVTALFGIVFRPAIVLQDIYNLFAALLGFLLAAIVFDRAKRTESAKKVCMTAVWLFKYSWQVLFRI
ncbi:MAG: glycosyltransferase [Sedimentisphaerales bacterium]|nr:glycosyltransferase [Sedimentisphaerales bacterium]